MPADDLPRNCMLTQARSCVKDYLVKNDTSALDSAPFVQFIHLSSYEDGMPLFAKISSQNEGQYLYHLPTSSCPIKSLSVEPSCAENISRMESRLESVKSILAHIDHSDVYILLLAIPLLTVFLLFRTWISSILTVMRWQYRSGYSGA